MTRRDFVSASVAAASLVCIRSAAGQAANVSVKARLSINLDKKLARMPADFTGLSYESAQLDNPAFFTGTNTGLVEKVRGLGSQGILRLGGNLGDYTYWAQAKEDAPTTAEQKTAEEIKNAYEWKLVDPQAAKDRFTVITPAAIRNLGAFLDATGWRLLYGLNLGSGSAERAAEEAACVHEMVGSRLVAFQVGNENDFFAPRHRPKPYTFDQYWTEYQSFVRAVRQRTPSAQFAGPDVAVRMDWVKDFATRAKGDTVLVTGHYYAMGPAGDPSMNADRLLHPDARLARQIQQALEAALIAGVPFRMTEGNSCFHGGQPGVSDAFASALWGADYMLFLAKSGYAGVNLHGGGNGSYSPIVGDQQAGISARPLYYGMQFAQRLAEHTFLDSQLDAGDGNASAYAAAREGRIAIAILNKDSRPLSVECDPKIFGSGKAKRTWRLTAPSVDSTSGVAFEEEKRPSSPTADATVNLAPYSGLLFTLE